MKSVAFCALSVTCVALLSPFCPNSRQFARAQTRPAWNLACAVFGDSIAAAYGASSPDKGWFEVVSARLGCAAHPNYSHGGDSTADQANNVYGYNVRDSANVSFTALGANDLSYGSTPKDAFGIDPDKNENFRRMDRALLAWLAVPASAKATGQNGQIKYVGHWTDSPLYTISGTRALGRKSCHNGDRAEVTFPGGDAVGMDLEMEDGNLGSVDFLVDGSLEGKYQAYGQNKSAIKTLHGTTHAPQIMTAFGLPADKPHVVAARVTSPSLGGCVSIHWAFSNAGLQRPDAPKIVSVGITRQVDRNTGPTERLDAKIQLFNRIKKENVVALGALGLKAAFVDVFDTLTFGRHYCKETCGGGVGDGTHPNDAGYEAIGNRVLSTVKTFGGKNP